MSYFYRTQEVSSSGQAMDVDSATTGCEAEDAEDMSGEYFTTWPVLKAGYKQLLVS